MGVQLIGKDVSLISSIAGIAKASIGSVSGVVVAAANPFLPGDFNFADGTTDYNTNTVTFTKSGKLYIYGTVGGNADWNSYCYKNGTPLYFYFNSTDAITYEQTGGGSPGTFLYSGNYAVVSVNIGDAMYFSFSAIGPFGDTGTVDIRINSFSGTLIDTINMTK